ncbi:MAG: hypothetical protein MJ232_03070 [archaeon]|nr:hypothetical protein [archaeon]
MAANNTFTSFEASLKLASPRKAEVGDYINFSAQIYGAFSRKIQISKDLYNFLVDYFNANPQEPFYLATVNVYCNYVNSSKCESPFISIFAK